MAAGVQLGFLKFVLGFDTLAFSKGATQADADLKKLQKSFERQGKALANAGKTLTLGLTAPLAAFGALSFQTASDAAELQSSFDTTFGKMSGTMNKWAEETGNALGRSTREMQQAANIFGIFFNTAVPPEKAAQMSQTFSMLAQDLGSFFNVDTGTAIEKLRAGLAGESEPLRAFGVFLNEAAVKAKALELGLGDAGGVLTEQEKIQARYALILEQTAKAQGDVERTSGGTANQIRKSKAAFEELQVIVGTKLLPVLTPLIEKLGKALEWFVQLPAPVQNTVLGIAAFSALLGPVLTGLGPVVGLLGKLGPIVGPLAGLLKLLGGALGIVSRALLIMLANPVILGAAVVIGGIYLAWKNWDKIEPIVRRLYTAVKTWVMDKLGAVFDWVKAKLKAVGDWFQTLYTRVVGNSYFPDMVIGIGVWAGKLGDLMVKPILDAVAATSAAFGTLPDVVPGAVTGEESAGADVPGAVDEFGRGTEQLAEDARTAKARVIEEFGQMAAGVVGSLKDMVASFKSGDILSGIQGMLDLVLQVLTALSKVGVIKTGGTPPIAGARAAGGPVVPGKTYLVGERGPEFITPRRSGFVHPNGSGGGQRVMIVPSPYFEAVVDGRARNVAAPMATQASVMGAGGATMMAARRARQTIR
jgi:hypothetical protein